jgi:competence protein ComEC
MTYLKELSFGIPHTANSLISKAGEVQRYMVEQLNLLNSPDSEKAVLATITVGYRQAMNSELNRQFATTGVSHILSVSGYHVGIVSGFVTVLLSFIPNTKTLFRWIKFLLTILTVWAFTYISGLSTAAVRAAVMISIFLTARVLSRTYDSYNTLAGAAFCMLVYNPFYLFDIGFQLSYIAVFFLLYLQPRFRSLLAIRNPLIAVPWDAVTVTCAAQLGAIFLCFYYFGQSSLVFVFTNLFMSLISIILIPATLLWMLLPKWIPGISILTGIIEYLSHNMMWVIGEYASMPGAALSLRFDFFTMVMSYMTLAFVLIYSRTKRFRHLAASLVSLLIILVWYLIKG